MIKFVALIRGIGPTDPNLSNARLRGVFESLGFKNVQSIIMSGNILFESNAKAVSALEIKVEKAFEKQLGVKRGVFIRSLSDLQKLIKKDPFKGKIHSKESYLVVTFLKEKPYQLFNNLDTTKAKTVDFMTILDKKFGKENTTRTWKTIQKIVAKMQA